MRVLFDSVQNHQSEIERIQLVLLNSQIEENHGVPCGGWSKDISSDIHNVIEGMSVLQLSFFDTVKSTLAEAFERKHFGITQIRDICLCFLRSYRTEKNRIITIYQQTYDCFDDATLVRIANLATAIYLEEWLRRDNLSHQSIENFAAQPYIPKKRSRNGQYSKTDSSYLASLRRAYRKYVPLYELRKWQQTKESAKPSVLPYNRKSNGRKIDLTTLAWCDAYSNGALDILKYLFDRKSIMNRKGDIGSKANERLIAACKSYHNYIISLKALDTSIEENARKFVASSMMLRKLEQAYRFGMNANIAHQHCKGQIDIENYQPNAANIFLGRIVFNGDSLLAPNWTRPDGVGIEGNEIIWPKRDCVTKHAEMGASKKAKRYTYIDEPYDVIENSYYIDNIYPASDYTQSAVEARLHGIRRTLLQDLILFLNVFYPPAHQRAWKPADFFEAVEFYRSAYPVVGTLSQTSFPSINETQPTGDPIDIYYVNRFYKLFRDVYTTQDYDTSYLRKAREELKKQEKQDVT